MKNPRNKAEFRDSLMSVAFTASEREAIRRAAEVAHLPPSIYVRVAVLEKAERALREVS
jgi:hypothetical protein